MKLIEIIKNDIYRYYGKNKLNIKDKITMDKELKFIISYRKANYYRNNKLKKYFYILKHKRFSKKCACQLPYTLTIGKGFYIGHLSGIIINPKVIFGDNVNVAQGVTIGQENRGKRKGTPVIGNEVWIGANAVVVGKIKIGNNVLIAPNSYVNFDVPDNSIVIGNPGKIINKDNATEDYAIGDVDEWHK